MTKKHDAKRFREKLGKLFALLGSSNAHESETARRKIDQLLASNRKTWNDLTELLQTGKDDGSWNDPDNSNDAAAPPAGGGAAGPSVNPFDLIYYTLEKYLHVKPHELVAITLWIMHTFVFDRFMITPRLALLSPVRGCGKSTAIDILELLTLKPEKFDHTSPANLYHIIDEKRPTLLLDEVDNMDLTTPGPLRSILNSGHKAGGSVGRVARGGSRRFSTFAPVAFGAIGTLPLPLMHRSIIVNMERAPRSANLERFDCRNAEQIAVFDAIYRVLFRWTQQCQLDPDPPMPAELHNRRADNWRVLLAIADACSHGVEARKAVVTMSLDHQDEDPGVELLRDVRTIFNAKRVDRLAGADIVVDLHGFEDSIWAEWRGLRGDQRPHKLSQAELAALLRPFGIRPKSIWPSGPRTGARSKKGYTREQFEAAWRSYCSEEEGGTSAQAGKIKHLRSS
jgi:hypothetical protein